MKLYRDETPEAFAGRVVRQLAAEEPWMSREFREHIARAVAALPRGAPATVCEATAYRASGAWREGRC